MAKLYRVVNTTLRVGSVVDGENKVVEVPPGTIVRGLTKEQMRELWEAGVLEEVAAAPVEEPVTKAEALTKPDAEGSVAGGDEGKPSAEA